MVGRITQIAGGDWGDQMKVGTEVELGTRFFFSDGLVEITYNNGAQVILAGPAVFEAGLPNGGFLRLGKVLVRSHRRGQTGKASGGTGLASGTPADLALTNSMTIDTPTTAMTGWGGSFGAWVDHSGATFVARLQRQNLPSVAAWRKNALPGGRLLGVHVDRAGWHRRGGLGSRRPAPDRGQSPAPWGTALHGRLVRRVMGPQLFAAREGPSK